MTFRTDDLYVLFDFEGQGEHIEIGLHQFELSDELINVLRTATFGGYLTDDGTEFGDADVLLVFTDDHGDQEEHQLSHVLEHGVDDAFTLVGWNTQS